MLEFKPFAIIVIAGILELILQSSFVFVLDLILLSKFVIALYSLLLFLPFCLC